ncbi:unnamed protein product, partial [Rotaria sordida]
EYGQYKKLPKNHYPNNYKQQTHSSKLINVSSMSHSNRNQQNQVFDQHQQQITTEGNIKEKLAAQEVKNYWKSNFQTDICIVNIRRSSLT